VIVACTTTEPEDSFTTTWSLLMPGPDWSAIDSLIASFTLLIMFGFDDSCWYKIPFIVKFTSRALSVAVVLVEVLDILVVLVEVLLTNVLVVEVLVANVVVDVLVVVVDVLVVVVVLLDNVVVVEVLLTPVLVVGHIPLLQLMDSDNDAQSPPSRCRIFIPLPQVFEHPLHSPHTLQVRQALSLQLTDSDVEEHASPKRVRVLVPPPQVFEQPLH